MPKRAVRKTKQQMLPTMRQTPREVLLDLIKQYRQKIAIGSACYQKADELMGEIRDRLKVNRRFPVGDGLYAVLVDLFEETDKVFKPVAMKRWELQIQDANGSVVRMRDRKRKSSTKRKK